MDLSERWWYVIRPSDGRMTWCDEDPRDRLVAAWEGAEVRGPFVLQQPGAVDLTDDETRALVWAAHRASRSLRAEGWPDMKNNAEILDCAVEKLEATNHSRGAVDP